MEFKHNTSTIYIASKVRFKVSPIELLLIISQRLFLNRSVVIMIHFLNE